MPERKRPRAAESREEKLKNPSGMYAYIPDESYKEDIFFENSDEESVSST